jgi:peptidoglycan/LPS O-acetylase OafA/YrhL
VPEATVADQSRVAYRPRHIPALDGVRGLAVLVVFLFHYAGGTHSGFPPLRLFGMVNKGGWSGVVLFFVLSGFLITGILWDSFDDPHWWRKFFARRSLRIFPLYYLALALVVIGGYAVHTGWATLRQMWVPGLFLENVPPFTGVDDRLPSPLGIFHLWSIAVEEQFYLLWPWLLYLFARRRTPRDRDHAKWLCVAIFVLSLLFRAVVWTYVANTEPFGHFLPTQAGALALGGWLALAYRGPEWPRVLRLAPMVAVSGLLGFAASGIFSHDFDAGGAYMITWGLPLVSLLCAGLVALALQRGLVARFFSMGWLRWLGNMSYGIYVYHMLILGLVVKLTYMVAGGRSAMQRNAVQFVIAAVLSLALAVVSYHMFEKQFLRLKKYFIPRVDAGTEAQPRGSLAPAATV